MSYCSLWTWSSFWAWLYFAFMKLIFKVSLEGKIVFKTIWKLHYSFPNLIWSFSISNPWLWLLKSNGLSELDSFKKPFLLASNLAFQLCCHMLLVICHYDVCSKLTKKTPKQRHWSGSGVFIINFEHIWTYFTGFLVFLLLTLNK